jgi:hypothetical protein
MSSKRENTAKLFCSLGGRSFSSGNSLGAQWALAPEETLFPLAISEMGPKEKRP